jgi:hypothetical protein
MVTSADKADPVIAYCDAVTEISRANAETRTWWYTWLSSRDRFNSRVFDACFAAAVGAPQKPARGGLLLGFVQITKEVAAVLEGWIVARLHPVRWREEASIIVIAPTADRALGSQNTPYSDPYFGILFEWLRAHGETPGLIGLPQGNRRRTVTALAKRNDMPCAALHHYLRFRDIVSAVLHAARANFKVPALGLPGGDKLISVIRADLAAARGDILFGLLVERAIGRALKLNPQARIIHTYENNPWERAVALAARDQHPPREVTGYLHCAVLPSHLKNFQAPQEKGLRPAPHRIVCTGPAARALFLSLGAHDPTQVVAGCALRDPEIFKLRARATPPPRVETVLVLLEALQSTIELLRFLKAAAPTLAGRRVLLRPHPMMPLEALLPGAGIRLGDNIFAESRPRDLAAALEESDVALYQSSTAAFTALAMGIPVVKVSLPLPFDDDPLLACDALKRIVKQPEALVIALKDFEAMSQAAYLAERDQAADYMGSYLVPPDEITLRPFLADRSSVCDAA